jgi:UDP-2-acetamido-2,6-beta-L-arabino-hexul-4-ose reductase
MNIVVTGAEGFIGKNLCAVLAELKDVKVVRHDVHSREEDLQDGIRGADFVFHLAGANRPVDPSEFESGNYRLTANLMELLGSLGRSPPIVFSSSVQATLGNPYGLSKRRAEEEVAAYGYRRGTRAYIYRLPNVFGKWARPFYNSVVATFCHQAARGEEMRIDDPARVVNLVHIDDVVSSFIGAMGGHTPSMKDGFCGVDPVFSVTLGELAAMVRSFHLSRTTNLLPDLGDPFVRRLYSTFVSYLPSADFNHGAEVKADGRGCLFEVAKSTRAGQIFISRTLPGVIRGRHYHHSKVEKFCVVDGIAVIALRSLDTNERVEIQVSGRDCRIVEIPPGWTHAIRNTGTSDLITIFWASEVFDPARPDTYGAEV